MNIGTQSNLSNAELAAELHALGVHFVRSDGLSGVRSRLAPATLMAGLVTSDEARLRLALLPLLWRHPSFAHHAERARQQLSAAEQVVFTCSYTAAWLLQAKYQSRMAAVVDAWQWLPDLYSVELDICPFDNPDEGLCTLAERQRELSGRAINWLGTYEHAAQRWLAHMEKRQRWTI